MVGTSLLRADARSPKTRAPGRARRAALLAAARALLAERALDQVTLPLVAERAGIPPSSVYHLFPDADALLTELARAISREMAAVDERRGAADSWRAVVSGFLRAQARFFNADAAARALMLGPKTSFTIKRAACHEDDRFGHALEAAVGRSFVLPGRLPDGLFFKAVQIADVFYGLSVAAVDRVDEAAQAEAESAVLAYLGLHLPEVLTGAELGAVA